MPTMGHSIHINCLKIASYMYLNGKICSYKIKRIITNSCNDVYIIVWGEVEVMEGRYAIYQSNLFTGTYLPTIPLIVRGLNLGAARFNYTL